MTVLLTLDEGAIHKVKKHLQIVHKNPSAIFSGKYDVTVKIENEKDGAALFVAGREVPYLQPRRA